MVENFPITVTKAACGVAHTLFLTDANRIYASGDNTEGNLGQGRTNFVPDCIPLQVGGFSDQTIVDIQAGRHSAALTAEG